MWGGFAFFWEYEVLTAARAPFFFMLWGLPFVAMGLQVIFGRFLVDAKHRASAFGSVRHCFPWGEPVPLEPYAEPDIWQCEFLDWLGAEIRARAFDAVTPVDQRGKQMRFPLEPREPLRIVDERLGQNFERDIAPELRVFGTIDLAHPADAEWREDFVRTETRAGSDADDRLLMSWPIVNES
jgi:hypothetical protein